MAIMIGSARIGENGKTTGGEIGDQKQKSATNDTVGEVSMQPFYIHSKGWYVLRPKSAQYAEAIAKKMITACNNANIGYNQNNRYGIIKYGTGSSVKTEADCSTTVRQCVKEATGVDAGDFTTSNEVSKLTTTGLFEDKFIYVSQDKTPLYNGDILITKTKGHTAIVVSGNPRVTTTTTSTTTTSKLKIDSNVKVIQTWLNKYYSTGLTVDGKYGTNTKKALCKAWQKEVGLTADGIFGTKSKTTAKSHIIKKDSTGILVTIWQAYLVCRGYDVNGIDGDFGSGCHTATVSYQKANSLGTDGIVGVNTWTKAFS
jgi:hypothetical protein